MREILFYKPIFICDKHAFYKQIKNYTNIYKIQYNTYKKHAQKTNWSNSTEISFTCILWTNKKLFYKQIKNYNYIQNSIQCTKDKFG